MINIGYDFRWPLLPPRWNVLAPNAFPIASAMNRSKRYERCGPCGMMCHSGGSAEHTIGIIQFIGRFLAACSSDDIAIIVISFYPFSRCIYDNLFWCITVTPARTGLMVHLNLRPNYGNSNYAVPNLLPRHYPFVSWFSCLRLRWAGLTELGSTAAFPSSLSPRRWRRAWPSKKKKKNCSIHVHSPRAYPNPKGTTERIHWGQVHL